MHSKEVRSFNMSQIKAKNTRPEIIVRKFLHARGFRFRIHSKLLPGKPDIVLPRYRTVIFINGCFWHGHHECRYFVVPKTRTEWWLSKISKNQTKDSEAVGLLHKAGWNIITVWECELKKNAIEFSLNNLAQIINDPSG